MPSVYKEALVVLAAAGRRYSAVPSAARQLGSGLHAGRRCCRSLRPCFADAAYAVAGRVTSSDPDSIEPIGRLGVALLLFMIGLELSFERLWLMRRLVFGLGCLQVMLCTLDWRRAGC